jgi:uncharacterized protein (TIGR02452 family)
MMTKEDRIDVFMETVDIVLNEGAYTNEDGDTVKLSEYKSSQGMTDFRSSELRMDFSILPEFDETVSVINLDCLELAKNLNGEGYHVGVLNMADFAKPGGGVLNGSKAQEESLFRRTNLFTSLYQYHEIGEEFGIEQKEGEKYPLDMNYGVIYTPNVCVFRDSEENNCKFLKQPFIVDVVSAAAIKNPTLDSGGHIIPSQVLILKNKIRAIFNISLLHGIDALVLSAFGCGAYKTPPEEMAKIFHEVIDEPNYRNRFKRIFFAIINDYNTYKQHNTIGNYTPFAEEFNC